MQIVPGFLKSRQNGDTMAKESMKLVANNKKAYHDYFVDEKYEAGIALYSAWENAVSRNLSSVLRMEKCSYMECISARMKWGIFLTKIHYVLKNC